MMGNEVMGKVLNNERIKKGMEGREKDKFVNRIKKQG